jgi:hypothetical protein
LSRNCNTLFIQRVNECERKENSFSIKEVDSTLNCDT